MLPFKENIELLPKSETDEESNHQGTNSNNESTDESINVSDNESIQDLDSISKDDDTNIISTFGLFDG